MTKILTALMFLLFVGALLIAPPFLPKAALLGYYYGALIFIVMLTAMLMGMRNEVEDARASDPFVEPPLMPSDPISERMIDVADDAFRSGSSDEQAWRECLGDALYAVYPLIREQVMAEASQGKRAVSALLPVNEPPEKPDMTRWEKKQVDGFAATTPEPETDEETR